MVNRVNFGSWHAAICCLFLTISYAGTSGAADVLIPTRQITESAESRYFIISIGVNDYQDSFWPTLKWPSSDASKIASHMGKETPYPVAKTVLLNEDATLDHVYQSLNQVSQEADENDIVLLYVSSHGTLALNPSGDLERVVVLHDSRKDSLFASGLSHKVLQDWLDRLQARRKMMVFATCHSGEGKSRLPPAVLKVVQSKKGNLAPLSEASEGALVLAAAAKGEAAHENDTLQGDIYTYYLIEALATYDRNHDGMVSALEAHDYAKEKTWQFTQGKQRPTANARFIGDADIPLFGKKQRSGLPVLEAYDERLAGFQLQVGDGSKGRLPFAFPVNTGGSRVTLYTPEGDEPIASYYVSLGEGDTITLDEVMTHRPLNFALSYRRHQWQDKTWKRISGESVSYATALSAGYNWSDLAVVISMELSPDQANTIRSPIRTSTQLQSHFLGLVYRYPLQSMALSGRMDLGWERMKITLHDTSSSQSLNFEDDTFSQGLSLSLDYEIAFDLFLSLEGGWRRSQWKFDTIGKLDGNRRWVGLGLNYRFGWSARSLW